MQKNQQKPVPALKDHDGQELQVHSIFQTIQGEGPYAGRNAVFVRLQDCNLDCPFCDTIYTGGQSMSYRAVADRVSHLAMTPDTVCVITGGEPLRQNLAPLCADLVNTYNVPVQIETNGTVLSSLESFAELMMNDGVTIVCSPKTRKIHDVVAAAAHAFKYVVQAGSIAPDGLPTQALGLRVTEGYTVARPPSGWEGPVYVQPMDEQDPTFNMEHRRAAVAAVTYPKGPAGQFRILQLQMHKEFGLE